MFLSSPFDWNTHHGQLCYIIFLYTCLDSGKLLHCNPCAYLACSQLLVQNGDNDNTTFCQAMHGPYATEYTQAMQEEIGTLVHQHTWDSVPCPLNKKVLQGIWVFKLKRLPDGTPAQFKARFCAQKDMQTEGIDFFEAYAPVVQWSTICLLLTTILTEAWCTCQVEYTNAFAKTDLVEELYVEYLCVFGPSSNDNSVLKLCQAKQTFLEKL